MIFTNTPHSRALAHCVMPLAPHYRAGDSQSSNTTKNENKDMRIAGGNASVNVSADNGSQVKVISTDHGAVAGGLQLASQAVDATVKNGKNLQDTTLTMFQGALGAVQDSYSKVATDLATAYTDSKTPDKSILMVGGAVVVGLVGVMLLAGRA
jgi:hypothetical protein